MSSRIRFHLDEQVMSVIARESIGQIVESLLLIYEVYTPEEMVGRVEYL